jgi:hypothetical protein
LAVVNKAVIHVGVQLHDYFFLVTNHYRTLVMPSIVLENLKIFISKRKGPLRRSVRESLLFTVLGIELRPCACCGLPLAPRGALVTNPAV